jgi:hypothetical protein
MKFLKVFLLIKGNLIALLEELLKKMMIIYVKQEIKRNSKRKI